MTHKIKLLDVVALIIDLPEYNLWRDQVGTGSMGGDSSR